MASNAGRFARAGDRWADDEGDEFAHDIVSGAHPSTVAAATQRLERGQEPLNERGRGRV